jgi:Domain of Unknown Function with PDB structure (DUF3857)/Transglutaminase-like superfamily
MKTLAIAALALGALTAHGAPPKDAPSWVQEVSSRALPSYRGRVPAAVLLSEQHVTVDSSGLMTTTTREAIKILTHEGQRRAVAEEYYFTGGRKVKQLRAWLVAPDGFVKTYDKNAVMDVGAFGEMELYNDIRVRIIKAESPEIGAVFAYESEVEEKPLFAQDRYAFQSNLPAVQSRYVVTLPPGWTATGVLFNHEPVTPIVDGSTYTWELKELPFREPEEHSPAMLGLVPGLAVDFHPPANTQLLGTCFHSWNDVARWHAQLAAGQDEVTPEIAAKVHELTAASPNEFAKIQAIGRYVQKIKYVAIEMDQSRGGGYKPHAANAVFRKQYGDCKDKANLMRAMLKAAGIQSYLLAISAEDRTFVREEWPSPRQFNHMILAIRVSEGTSAPAIISSPAGPLLPFDATSEVTPLGDLPWIEQGSFALLCASGEGTLIKMPVLKPEANLLDLTVEGSLTASGELTASVSTVRSGQSADMERYRHVYNTPDEFRRGVESTLTRTIKSPVISNLDVQDAFDENTFRLKLNVDSQLYGQLMQGRLLLFGASVLEPPGPNFSHSLNRTEPILLRAAVYRKHVRIKLPAGFSIDEMPDSLNMDSDFARFSLKFQHEGDTLIVEEELAIQPVNLPAADYQRVKKFFDNFDGADQQRAVLVKTGV